jgi:hypothetical protein
LGRVTHEERLQAFDAAIEAFRESSRTMQEQVHALCQDHTLPALAGLTTYDVACCCDLFCAAYKEVHENGAEWWRAFQAHEAAVASGEFQRAWDEARAHAAASPQAEPEEELDGIAALERTAAARLGITLKALYLFTRAHQDSLCALAHLAQRPRGTPAGEYSMTTHLGRDGGPVLSLLRETVPAYEGWYRRWRPVRDRIKRGLNFGLIGKPRAEEWGVTFYTVDPEDGGALGTSEIVWLGDVTEALEVSTQLHHAITHRAAQSLAGSPTQSG